MVTSTPCLLGYINTCSVRGSDPPATPSVRPHQSARYCALWAPSAEGGATQAPRCGDLPQVPKWPLENRVCSVRAHWLTSGRELGSASNDVGSTCSDVFSGQTGSGGALGRPSSHFEQLGFPGHFGTWGRHPIANKPWCPGQGRIRYLGRKPRGTPHTPGSRVSQCTSSPPCPCFFIVHFANLLFGGRLASCRRSWWRTLPHI